MFRRRGHTRDGCRVPLPWSGDEPPYGFTVASPWLPQPAEWKDRTVQAQTGDPNSMLELYRAAIHLRRSQEPDFAWLDLGDEVLAYTRGTRFACVLNLSGAPVPLPEHETCLLASGPLDGDLLPQDTAVWLRL